MRRRLALALIAIVAAGTAGALRELGAGRELELETVDLRFDLGGPIAPPDDVVLAQVDDRTLSELQLRWPFPRSRHARVIDRLSALGARVIAIDLQFTEPTDIDEDNALIEAIARAEGVVLSTTVVDDQGSTNVLGGDDVVSDIGARVGSALLPLDPDGALRRAAYAPDGLESFAVVVTEVATRRQVQPFDEERTWIRYAGPPGTLRSYSYSQVLRGRVPAEAFRDKIVVVGTEAARLKDVSATSTTDDSLMSGPEVQGNAIATVLAGLPMTSAPGLLGTVLILIMACAAPLSASRLGPGGTTLVAGLAALALAAAAQLLFGAGVVIPVVHPLAALGLGLIGALAVARPRPPAAEPAAAPLAPTEPQPKSEPAPEAAEAPTAADEIAGFRLEGVIGRGGMGVIYEAHQPGLDRKVAVKVIAPDHAADPRFRQRFAREARLAAAIDHPNIVPVHATGEDGGRLYLAMRYVEGGNLAQRLRAGPLPLAATAEIVAQVASALDAAHERGLVHRDVKPANILLVERPGARPHAYLTDFGITRAIVGTADLTQTGVFMGTVDYAAPEQASGAGAGPSADQYALASVAYECLTGRPPCKHEHDMATLWAHVNEPPQPPSQLVPELGAEVDAPLLLALAKNPDERWPTCAAFAQALASALAMREPRA
jgi:CHASE2 domain-containing sensor protein